MFLFYHKCYNVKLLYMIIYLVVECFFTWVFKRDWKLWIWTPPLSSYSWLYEYTFLYSSFSKLCSIKIVSYLELCVYGLSNSMDKISLTQWIKLLQLVHMGLWLQARNFGQRTQIKCIALELLVILYFRQFSYRKLILTTNVLCMANP